MFALQVASADNVTESLLNDAVNDIAGYRENDVASVIVQNYKTIKYKN